MYKWYLVFPGRKKRPGRDADPSLPLLPLWALRSLQSLSTCTRAHFTFPYLYLETNKRLNYKEKRNGLLKKKQLSIFQISVYGSVSGVVIVREFYSGIWKLLTEIFWNHESRRDEIRTKKHQLSSCGNAILFDGKCFRGMWKVCRHLQAKYPWNVSTEVEDVVKRVEANYFFFFFADGYSGRAPEMSIEKNRVFWSYLGGGELLVGSCAMQGGRNVHWREGGGFTVKCLRSITI